MKSVDSPKVTVNCPTFLKCDWNCGPREKVAHREPYMSSALVGRGILPVLWHRFWQIGMSHP